MKHLKYITLMLLVVLSAACEQMQLPDTDVIIEREKATDLTANSAVIEVEFYPTDATIKTVEVYYTEGLHYSKVMHKEMQCVSGLTYRAELTNLNSNAKYQVYYLLKNAFSTLEVNDDFSFRTAKNNEPSNVIDTVYHIDFRQTIGAWTVRNYMLPEGMGYVWRKTDQYGMVASAFVSGTNHASEAWLISSPLDLTSNTTAFLTFNQAYKYGDISQIAVKITTNGLDWTTLEVPVWPDGTSWLFINSGEIDITKYISATTQIAYAYTSSAEASPTWEIRDVLIKGNGTRIEEPAASVTAPTVTTSTVTQITETTAVAGGNVTSDGGASVTERGVVYSTSANPTTANSKRMNGSGTGAFTCNLTGLQPNTTYYVRAYAVNSIGTAYGEQVTFTTKEEVVATPEYVDLGLSVKWATFNVGASKPEEYGDYFAWGETESKDSYNWSTYKWCNGSSTTLTKYCTSSSYGTVDNKKTLELSDDAAYANWGGEWRTPTDAELTELRTQCTWTWTTQNGVKGYKVTSKINGRSIFLPAAGHRDDSSLNTAGSSGYYCLSTLYPGSSVSAYRLYFSSSSVSGIGSHRYHGRSVRPVCGQQVTVPTVTTSTVTQITETTAMAGGNVTNDGGASVTERGVVYSTTQNPTTVNNKVTRGGNTGLYACNLTGLQPNTTYYVRAYAVNSKGTSYGEEVSFTTLTPIVVPTVMTRTITQITETTAVAGGNVTSDGGASVTERGVVYSTSTNPTTASNKVISGSGMGAFTCNLTGLQPNTTYYVRAYAVNSKGASYGEQESFTTQIQKPTTPYFSVSETKNVTFSSGNLQYHPANNKWRFAESQLDYIGDANSNISSSYNGWLDLFGWSTSATNFGVSTSTSNSDYSGSFVDWGTNQIGADAPNTWRTLTSEEWRYLLNTRTNASSLKGVAQVNGVNGLIFLPDNWVCPAGVTFKSGFHSSDGADYYAAYQTFTADQWSKLEAAGAVFLPAAGYRHGSFVDTVLRVGYYWSATESFSDRAYCLYFYSENALMLNTNRNYGRSVRLVKDL